MMGLLCEIDPPFILHLRSAGYGRSDAFTMSNCLPNTGHPIGLLDALNFEIG
jgi:hypothetical protein